MKKEAKLAKMLQEEELRLLLGEGIANQSGKKKAAAKAEAEKLGLTKQKDEVAQLLETFSSDSSDGDDDDDPNGGVIYIPDEPVAVEVFREKTIEDIIEEQRAKLAAEGKVGTPVTAESFAKWRAEKLARKQAEAEARVKAEQAKKKGGKGLCKFLFFSSLLSTSSALCSLSNFASYFVAAVLSGKELFNYNSSLFVDDDAAIDAAEENALAIEMKKSEEEEERREKEEAEKAQKEQMRLIEAQVLNAICYRLLGACVPYILLGYYYLPCLLYSFTSQRLEEEARIRREEERRQLAAAADRVTFQLGDITINQIVFDVEDREDLVPFDEAEDDDGTGAAQTVREYDDDDDDDEEEDDDDEERDGDDDEEDEEDGDDEDDDEDGEAGAGGSEGAAMDDAS